MTSCDFTKIIKLFISYLHYYIQCDDEDSWHDMATPPLFIMCGKYVNRPIAEGDYV